MATNRVFYRCPAFHETVAERSSDTQGDDIACECGLQAKWFRILVEPSGGWPSEESNAAPYAFVKGRAYEFQKEHAVMPQGRHFGVSDEQHNSKYERQFTEMKNEAKKFRGGHSKQKTEAPQYLGSMSGEMVRSIGLQEGNPEAVNADPVTFLKKTGRYVGE